MSPPPQVNRLAQKTDAGQLSRNLLLVPRATVNVKPNLQIIADDVKCTHGAAISDLSEEELFYFRCKGDGWSGGRDTCRWRPQDTVGTARATPAPGLYHHSLCACPGLHPPNTINPPPPRSGRARGIPAEVARQSLVYSFGAEVVQRLRYDRLVARIQADVVATLREAEKGLALAAK